MTHNQEAKGPGNVVRFWYMVIAIIVGLGGCSSDGRRTDRIKVDGVDCIAVRDGFGRIKFVDCDWEAT